MSVGAVRLIDEFLGSANLLVSAVSSLLDEDLLTRTAVKDLTGSQLKILRLLAMREQGAIGDIAAFLGVSNPAASKAVEKLVRRRLVRRADVAGDRRSSTVTLTEQASRLVADYEAARRRRLAKVFKDIPDGELLRASALLDRVSTRIVSHGSHPEETCLQCGLHLHKRCLMREAAHLECSYEQRRSKRKGKSDGSNNTPVAANEVPAGSGPGVGPPRQRAAGL
jgi:DNA-binding MarR family transcriptional regulator